MTRLITVRKRGTLTRYCDAGCYLPGQYRTDCPCGGRNTGLGFRKALDNTLRHAAQIALELFDVEHPPDQVTIVNKGTYTPYNVQQLSLHGHEPTLPNSQRPRPATHRRSR